MSKTATVSKPRSPHELTCEALLDEYTRYCRWAGDDFSLRQWDDKDSRRTEALKREILRRMTGAKK